MYWIELDENPTALQSFLRSKSWIGPEERILVMSKPGEGNMNVVIRVRTEKGSFILKQSRPFVQKYRDVPAPVDRIHVEFEFYNRLHQQEKNDHLPSVLNYDKAEYLIMMNDLGHCQDMVVIYEERRIERMALERLIGVLKSIHEAREIELYPDNIELRRLNHQHIFTLPFLSDNGFKLDEVHPGLEELAQPYKEDLQLKETVGQLGKQYLSKGSCLIHGDYYPGSWLRSGEDIYVIDPEFSFVGQPEFDLGVMAGHLIMSSMKLDCIEEILDLYGPKVKRSVVTQLAGVEIMRRIIGLAQLPLIRTLDEKSFLLRSARSLVLNP